MKAEIDLMTGNRSVHIRSCEGTKMTIGLREGETSVFLSLNKDEAIILRDLLDTHIKLAREPAKP